MSHRSLVLHDAFAFPGGGEQVAVTLARAFDADLMTGVFDQAAFAPDYFGSALPQSLDAPGRHPLAARLSATLAMCLAFEHLPRTDVPLALHSGALTLLAHGRIAGPQVLYCHTPPRILYDHRDFYLARQSPLRRPAYRLLAARYRRRYETAIRAMDAVVANSQTVRRRIRQFLGLEAEVVHPPVATVAFPNLGQEPFYLSTARVDVLKRVDVVVEAFAALPDKRLVVVSGGSELARVRELAAGHANIEIRGWTEAAELRRLIGTAIATIYIPRDEDFGISPVESMAAGKPVIGVREGGLTETVVHGETGILLPPDPGPADVARAVAELGPDVALGMREACQRRAAAFDTAVFIRNMQAVAARVMAGRSQPTPEKK
ncbi:glycosyltransferase [Desulfovibrio sp. TomC]|uniref:glycosyltransferase n=1 Tax=Desulfovibrio sp. TomC TaxID=1562888 RepID=UPI00057525BE|nr:glycosyltransferase [Desulfovibrio sp. TomC]KHK01806.1 Glycosyl transferase, group 1 [Desulfovibrio sp. TomC]